MTASKLLERATVRNIIADTTHPNDDYGIEEALANGFSWLGDTEAAILVDAATDAVMEAIAKALSQSDRSAVLEEVLLKYGRHDGLCARIGGYGYCSCGLEAITDPIRKLKERPDVRAPE